MLADSLGMVFLLTIPSSVGLAVMGESMIGTVYQRGHFTAFDTHQPAVALACYSLGLAGYAAIKILAPAFYALGDARTPMLVSLASVAVNGAAAWAAVRVAGWGHAGLALSTSVVALFGAAVLFSMLRTRLGSLHGRRLATGVLKIAAASAVMAAVCRASSVFIHGAAGSARWMQAADVAVSIPLGAAVFLATARVFGVAELAGLKALGAACYTANRNAPRFEVGDPPAGSR
jgi:putative peptidoglycan lipid II flippase